MIRHLPVLQVALPLLCAPLALLLRRAEAVRTLVFAAAAAGFAISATLLVSVLGHGPISYALGGWPAPLGIEYRVDALNALVLCVVSGVAAVLLPLGPGRGGHNLPPERLHWFYAAFLLAHAGLLGVTVTGDLFNVFVFLEISSLASYVLVGLGRSRRALRAAFTYLVMGTIGGTFVLIGTGFVYQMTGTLNLEDLAQRLPAVRGKTTILAAFAFLSVGVSIKLALFPLHQWLPNAYAYAPPVVSAFLAATATKVAYYLLVRLVFTVFGAAFVFDELGLGTLLFPLSIAAMFAGALAAIRQADVKKLLAYSSVSQIGYLTLGLSFASLPGLTGGLVHLFNHALTKEACSWRWRASWHARVRAGSKIGGESAAHALDDGRVRRRGLGLIGVPGTAGFVSKWYLVQAALEAGRGGVALLILGSSLLAVVYVWRVVETAYFHAPPASESRAEAPLTLRVPTWILIGASLYFGLFTDWSAGVASQAAAGLLGIGP